MHAFAFKKNAKACLREQEDETIMQGGYLEFKVEILLWFKLGQQHGRGIFGAQVLIFEAIGHTSGTEAHQPIDIYKESRLNTEKAGRTKGYGYLATLG
jgi:hypothetical protein